MSDTELLLKPKPQPEPVRRLEVFTGAGRRRRWSSEQKVRIVSETYETGETVSAVARRHGLTPQQLFGWRRAWRNQSESRAGESSAAFAPIVVETAARPCPAFCQTIGAFATVRRARSSNSSSFTVERVFLVHELALDTHIFIRPLIVSEPISLGVNGASPDRRRQYKPATRKAAYGSIA
jgi:transposase